MYVCNYFFNHIYIYMYVCLYTIVCVCVCIPKYRNTTYSVGQYVIYSLNNQLRDYFLIKTISVSAFLYYVYFFV